MRLPTGQPWTNVGPWVLASLPFVFLVAWFWNRGPGLDADDWAQTLMHAEALVDGRPYGDIGYIASALTIAPPIQPPGLPMVLAAVMTASGGFHWWVVKLAMVLAALPFVLFAGLCFARDYGRPMGLAVTLMLTVAVAVRPPSGATQIQTDLGFSSLVWAVLFVMDRPAKLTWGRTVTIFLLATLAVSYRYLGAALVPAIATFALLHRPRGGMKLMAPVAVWAAGAVAVVALVGTSIITTQVSLDPTRLWRGVRPLISQYSGSAVEAHLYPLPWDLGNDAFHMVSLSLAIVGVVAWTRTRWKTGAWLFTAAYLLTLLMAFNRSGRYLIPLYPVLIFGFIHGLQIVIGLIRRRWPEQRARVAAAMSGGAVALPALVLLILQEPRTGGYLHQYPDTQSLFAYVSSEAATNETRVAFVQPRVLSWSTGIPAMVIPNAPADQMLPEMERLRITHVVIDRVDLQVRRTERMRETMEAHACRFEPVFENASFQAYRFLTECREA